MRVVAAAVAVAVLAGSPAAATTRVTISGVEAGDGFVEVFGTATFDAEPFSSVGGDPVGDQATKPAPAGSDLTGASMAVAPDGSVRLRWHLAESPAASPPLLYGWGLCVQEACWLVLAQLARPLQGQLAPAGALRECQNRSCTATKVVGSVPVTYDASQRAVTAVFTLPAGARDGGVVEPAEGPSVQGPVFVGTGEVDLVYSNQLFDGVPNVRPHSVPSREVAATVADGGSDPVLLAYAVSSQVSVKGVYRLRMDANGDGDTVFVRACFGVSCGYASAPLPR